MHAEIKDVVSSCTTLNKYAHEQQKETMMSYKLPTRAWQIISMDLFLLSVTEYLLIDHYSDF